MSQGMQPGEARAAGRCAFLRQSRGAARSRLRAALELELVRDSILLAIYDMVRVLLMRSPGFTLVSILVLVLGIGATTSLFGDCAWQCG